MEAKKVAFYTLRLQSKSIRNKWNDSKIFRSWLPNSKF